MGDIGIAIVTYNSGRHIGACLEAALPTGAGIVVVDNASSDETRAEVERRGVPLIANPSNRGFAAAANQGFEALRRPYILLLNPDAMIAGSLDPLRAACDLPGAAAAGGLLLDAGGRPQSGFMARGLPTPAALALEALLLNRLWPRNPVNRRYRCLDLDGGQRAPVEQPAGAFLMIRRTVWEELGGFDESFFPLWFEDVDFCRRLANRGYRTYYEPAAVAIHTGGHSIGSLSIEQKRLYWYGSLLRYAAKHFRPAALRAVCAAVVTGSLLRGIGGLALGSFQSLAVYGKVARLAGRYFLFGGRDGAWPRSGGIRRG